MGIVIGAILVLIGGAVAVNDHRKAKTDGMNLGKKSAEEEFKAKAKAADDAKAAEDAIRRDERTKVKKELAKED
jgi:hypothetical protein